MHGLNIDANFSLSVENFFNPIRRLRSGNNKVAAMKDIVVWTFLIFGALNGVGCGSRSSLF